MTTAPLTRQELLQKLADVLRDTAVEQVYLFGSYARGEADTCSDVDLVIVCPMARPFFERYREFPAVYELPFAVDLLVYTPEEFERMVKEGNPFIEQVLREGIRVK